MRFPPRSLIMPRREERVNQGGNGKSLGAITHQYERIGVWGPALHSRRFHATLLLEGDPGYRERMHAPAFTFDPRTLPPSTSRPRVPDGALYRTYGLYLQEKFLGK